MPSSVPPSFPPSGFPTQGQAPLPPGKKPNLLIWILGVMVVVMVGVSMTCGLGGYLLMRKAKDAGLDTNLIAKNPAYAAAKMALTMSPGIETVSSDDSTGTIKVREKATGKVSTFKFDPDKKTMVLASDDGKPVQGTPTPVQGTPVDDVNNGSLKLPLPGGLLQLGSSAGNQVPAWIPVYPGTTPSPMFGSQNSAGEQHMFTFKTSDPPAKVIGYYQDQFKSAGFTVNVTGGGDQGGLVQAEDGGKKRSVKLVVTASDGGTEVGATSIEAK